MKKWVRVAAFAIAIVLAVLGINATRMGSRQIDVPGNDETAPSIEASAQRLAQAVRFRTVSHQDASQFPVAEFDRFQAFLSETYPHIESTLKKRRVGQHSLLYQWPGTDTSLQPILLMAHQDVVPIDPVSAQMWTHGPFGGEIAEGFIWGRGTLDDKGAVMALHEAAETLASLPGHSGVDGLRPGK